MCIVYVRTKSLFRGNKDKLNPWIELESNQNFSLDTVWLNKLLEEFTIGKKYETKQKHIANTNIVLDLCVFMSVRVGKYETIKCY